jgi:alpha-1,2-mannosyltransferase
MSQPGPPASLERVARVALPALALTITGAYVALVVARASYTFAFDYLAYDAAARRLLEGAPLYDTSFTSTGQFGLFYYPPSFILGVLPFVAFSPTVASWVWLAATLVATGLAVALMPVRPYVRWLVLLLAGVSWPFLFAVKVGQVGPFLLLAFAAGWRWLDRQTVVGIVAAVGAAIKLQPGLLIVWLALTRRWRGLAVALGVGLAIGAVTTFVVGPGAWADFVTLTLRVGNATTSSQNFSPGSTAYFMGASLLAAQLVQLAWIVGVLALVVLAARLVSAESSYLLTAVASQIVSPILWDHYALVLLLPVAWLLQRRYWWAALIPLSQSAVLLDVTPPVGYLAGYVLALVALFILGRRERERAESWAPVLTTSRAPSAG